MALTLREEQLVAQRRVQNNLNLFQEYGFKRIDIDKQVFFYKQINPKIGCLIYYYCSNEKSFDLQGFDLFVSQTTQSAQAIDAWKNCKLLTRDKKHEIFWIPTFHVEKESHLECFKELMSEQEEDLIALSEKYKEKFQKRMWKDKIAY